MKFTEDQKTLLREYREAHGQDISLDDKELYKYLLDDHENGNNEIEVGSFDSKTKIPVLIKIPKSLYKEFGVIHCRNCDCVLAEEHFEDGVCEACDQCAEDAVIVQRPDGSYNILEG